MRRLILALWLGLGLVWGMEFSADVELAGLEYGDAAGEAVLQGDAALDYDADAFQSRAALAYLYSTRYEGRRYLLLQELYVRYESESLRMDAGQMIRFWGELEGFNPVDIYNRKNLLLDPFDKSAKLESPGVVLSYYPEGFTLEAGARLYEANQAYPEMDEPYYPFGAMHYDTALQLSGGRSDPSAYLKANRMHEGWLEGETKIVWWHGYDSKRAFLPVSPTTLAQYAYRADKLMLFSNLVFGAAIFKLEASMTRTEEGAPVDDYAQLGVGMEYGLYDIAETDITLYGEYYRYEYDDTEPASDIAQVYDDDLFAALRIALNDVRNTTLKSGLLYDLKNSERMIKLEASSRLRDGLVLNLEALRAVTRDGSLLEQTGISSRWMLGIEQSF